MSATKSGRGIASPESRTQPRAHPSRPRRASLFEPSPLSVLAPPREPTLELHPDHEAQPETWWESFQRAERALAHRLAPLWRMTPAQRVAAMRRGELTYEQLAAWSARFADEVPQINGEFEWIAARLPEVCE